jgi:hypothetical protein
MSCSIQATGNKRSKAARGATSQVVTQESEVSRANIFVFDFDEKYYNNSAARNISQ